MSSSPRNGEDLQAQHVGHGVGVGVEQLLIGHVQVIAGLARECHVAVIDHPIALSRGAPERRVEPGEHAQPGEQMQFTPA